MSKAEELAERLRLELIGRLHVGRLRPGSRLPSIRETARAYEVDHRMAARAYDLLQADGLIEVRDRSGVFVADAASTRDRVLDARQRWAVQVMTDAWSRRITMPELKHLMHRVTFHGLHCLVIESTSDHLIAVASELAGDFGFVITPVRLDADKNGDLTSRILSNLAPQLEGIDVIATTVFHATAVSGFARAHNREFLSITTNDAVRDDITRRLSAGRLRVVVEDPAFAARARRYLPDELMQNAEVVLARDYSYADDGVVTVFTKAARRALGLGEKQLLSGDNPFISAQSAAAICHLIARLST